MCVYDAEAERAGGRGAHALASHELDVEFVSSPSMAAQDVEPFIVAFNRTSRQREVWCVSLATVPAPLPDPQVSILHKTSMSIGLYDPGAGLAGDDGLRQSSKLGGGGRAAGSKVPLAAAHDEGDALALVHSHTYGWVACGSIGLGADNRSDWVASHSKLQLTRLGSGMRA